MNRNYAICFILLLGAEPAVAQELPRGDAKAGQVLYESAGCYECHGHSGAGSSVGPHLVEPPPLARFLAQLRLPSAVMPPYETNVLSDAQVADIYAFVQSLPK